MLDKLRSGRRQSLNELTVLLYDDLREIARRHRAVRGGDARLPRTALVHEAYLKLVDKSQVQWNDRAHLLALAAVAMRHILIGRARARLTAKRGAKGEAQ